MSKNVYVRYEDNRWEWAKAAGNFMPMSDFGRDNPMNIEVDDGTIDFQPQTTSACTVEVSPASVSVPRGEDEETFTITASCSNDSSKPPQSGYIKVKKSG